MLKAVTQRFFRAVAAGLPFTMGSAMALVATAYLVPARKKWLKAVGYSASAVLGVIGISKMYRRLLEPT